MCFAKPRKRPNVISFTPKRDSLVNQDLRLADWVLSGGTRGPALSERGGVRGPRVVLGGHGRREQREEHCLDESIPNHSREIFHLRSSTAPGSRRPDLSR
jgi:hypothetical protein